jgi:hypothetical protein
MLSSCDDIPRVQQRRLAVVVDPLLSLSRKPTAHRASAQPELVCDQPLHCGGRQVAQHLPELVGSGPRKCGIVVDLLALVS